MSLIDSSLTRPFVVRPMEERDLNQTSEVEKDAFPTLFPSTSFRRELNNKISRYLVVSRSDDGGTADPSLPPLPHQGSALGNGGGLLDRVMRGAARHIWRQRNGSWKPGDEFIAGFVGVWHVAAAGEAHIVSIGVRTEYRGLGLGEALLLAAIERAIESGLGKVTLEVRVSNHVAQNLYKKYGFMERGRRRGYYTDNREDALIMTTPSILTDSYKTELRRLAASYEMRRGPSERHPVPRLDD